MGGSVNSGAQAAEQQNQLQGEQYAAQQQKAALDAVNAWTAANKPPGQSAAPMQPPVAHSPATMGGGNIQAGQAPPPMPQGQMRPQMQRPPQPGQPPAPVAQPAAAPPQAPPAPGAPPPLTPQQRAMLMAQLHGQTQSVRN